MKNAKYIGAVATQQALVKHFGLTIRRAASIAQVHPRTLHSHVKAKPGAKVTPWENRPVAAQKVAVDFAKDLIKAANASKPIILC